MRHFLFSCLFAGLGAALRAHATSPEEIEFFEKRVRPVLSEQCYKCHGPDKQKAELRVDSREAILKGTDLGPVVVPGKPEESSFIKSIRHEGDSKMPEKADKMPDDQINALTEWVKMGLPWPENDQPGALGAKEKAKQHWAYQPIRHVTPPDVSASPAAVHNEIDAFIVQKLEEAGLEPSPPADKRTLIRRATFDLIGLPPTVEEVAAFENDTAPDAFAKVIDRLLASPAYGERWGRHWLDVARYADSKGYVFQEERKYPFAYTYRDWVIRAFNEDLPFDQFVIQQLAADFVASKEDPSPLAAMGFLTVGRRFLNNQHDIIDDRIDLVGRGLMGLTIACARCHDHKFDPIEQKDYYALYGVFASSREPSELPALPDEADGEARAKFKVKHDEKQAELDRFLAEKSADLSLLTTLTTGVPVVIGPVERATIRRLVPRPDRDRAAELQKKVDATLTLEGAPPRAMVMEDLPSPVQPHVFVRGNPGRPGEEVDRRFVSILSRGQPEPFKNGSGRLELAQAIVSRDNPLTARVFVNRVWAHHFARGLVRTPGDFGVKGEPPTHPELLDWLATRFMDDGWSIKKLHRLIMLSSTYQQAADANEKLDLADPDNRLVGRQNRQRLDFEATRDSLLCVAGQLDGRMGGRAGDISDHRRTVYAFIDRQNLPGVFRTFDFATPDTTNPQRFVTTVPQQALFMMNSPFVMDQARALVDAEEFSKNDGASEWQVQELYERVLARRAEPAEVENALRFIATEEARPIPQPETPLWQYGYGRFDEGAKTVHFNALPQFNEGSWRGGPKLPAGDFGYTSLSAGGGHPGPDADHAAILRWTAPIDAMVNVSGDVSRPSENGDGIEIQIVSSRGGLVTAVIAEPKATVPLSTNGIEVKAGDTLDFIASCRTGDNSDSFTWGPRIEAPGAVWNAAEQFSGPRPTPEAPLTPWEKIAQVLLSTNEFVFVD